MPYNPDELHVEWNDKARCYDVWYDGYYLGSVSKESEAHDLAVNRAMVCEDMNPLEDR